MSKRTVELQAGLLPPKKDGGRPSIFVETPKGQLTAKVDTSVEFPGITIYLNGATVVAVEHDPKKGIRVLIYDKDAEEPSIVRTRHDGKQ